MAGTDIDAIPRTGGVSPMAQRLAQALGVELARVVGSGRHGRILKADVRATPAAPAAPVAAPLATELWCSVDVDMSASLELVAQLRATAEGEAPSLDDLIVALVGRALRRHPRVNGRLRNGTFEPSDRVHVAMARATGDSMVAATIADADRASIGHLAREARRAAEQDTTDEVATFTVSSLGTLRIDRFGASTDATATLCVGAVKERAWAVDGVLAVRPVATLTLLCDERSVPAGEAAALLATVAGLLEQPLAIML